MSDSTAPDSDSNPGDKVKYWLGQLELSKKAKGYITWQNRAKAIIKRYRDERSDQDGAGDPQGEVTEGARFNILWSNVQTLMPALFGKTPKPVVERRYLDRDEVGRTASVILERALLYELDEGNYTASLRKAVMDRLLPGRGVVWVRYEPKFTAMPGKTQEAKHENKGTVPEYSGEGDAEAGQAPKGVGVSGDIRQDQPQEATTDAPEEQVADESVIVDYIDWDDFRTSPARTWEEVWWVAKRVYMTRDELVKRFGDIGKQVQLDWSPVATTKSSPAADPDAPNDERRAKVWEFWDKTTRKVCWVAESYKDGYLDEKDDPLKLQCFWPVPKPLYATLTNNSLVPVPDYHEYRDQAAELDDLTGRIGALVKTIKVAGIYDASIPELGRIFQEGKENELVPTSQMQEFSAKAGPDGMGAIWLVDIKKQVAALKELYMARNETKQVLYEITGISDIVRGQATAGSATATEQRIKGQFASMRLNDMQNEVARFARDTLRIMGELISEHFDPMTLFEISGFEQYATEQWPADSFQQEQNPMMGHNGGPPMSPPGGAPPAPVTGAPGGSLPPQAAGPQPPMMGSIPPELLAKQKAADIFKRSIELLRNDKLRGFRIDIETDSLVEADQQQTQQSRTELLGAIAQFLPQAIQAGMAMPELKPLLARLLMFFLRGFKASRDIESAFEQFIDDMTKEAANPKPAPPSPEQIKAQAEMQKQQAENQRMAAQAQIDQQNQQAEMAAAQQKMQMDMQLAEQEGQLKLQALQADMAFKEREYALKERAMLLDIQAKERAAQISAASAEHSASVKAASTEHSASVAKDIAETKAKQAKEPAEAE